MARTRTRRLWTLPLWGVCLLVASTAHLGGSPDEADTRTAPAAVAVLSQTYDAAVLPARLADEVRAAGHTTPLRPLVLAAVLAVLLGLPAVRRGRASATGAQSHPLRARRHSIALRAPPLQFA